MFGHVLIPNWHVRSSGRMIKSILWGSWQKENLAFSWYLIGLASGMTSFACFDWCISDEGWFTSILVILAFFFSQIHRSAQAHRYFSPMTQPLMHWRVLELETQAAQNMIACRIENEWNCALNWYDGALSLSDRHGIDLLAAGYEQQLKDRYEWYTSFSVYRL